MASLSRQLEETKQTSEEQFNRWTELFARLDEKKEQEDAAT